MKVFDRIAVIYNPRNPDNAVKTAKDIADSVNGHYEVIQTRAVLYPSKHGIEMEETSYDITRGSARPLIIIVGEDSEYNEVINGIMRAKKLFPAQKPIIVYLPAHRTTGENNVLYSQTPLIRMIKHPHFSPIDLMAATIKTAEGEIERYAGHVIGFGLPAGVNTQLSRTPRLTSGYLARLMRSSRTQFHATHADMTLNLRALIFLVGRRDKNGTAPAGFAVIPLVARRLSTVRASLESLLRRSHSTREKYSIQFTEPIQMLCDNYQIDLPSEARVMIKFHSGAFDTIS